IASESLKQVQGQMKFLVLPLALYSYLSPPSGDVGQVQKLVPRYLYFYSKVKEALKSHFLPSTV
ncbi:MAG: hypothetical protein QXP01_01000, partial [Candidatus Hadarchaeum sp.]